MSSFEQLKAQALELGLSGADVAQYVLQQQNGEREERAREREETLAKLQAEKEVQLAQISASKKPASQIVEAMNGACECVASTRPGNQGTRKLVVPADCRRIVLQVAHESPLAGHFSHRKTEDKHRYLVPTFFALRELPSDRTGFFAFDLLYGRSVRGPFTVLKDLWEDRQLKADDRNSLQYVIEMRNKLQECAQLAAQQADKCLAPRTLYNMTSSLPPPAGLRPSIIRCDTSNFGLGAVLLQDIDGTPHPVAFASRKLLDREPRYATTEKEALAIIFGVKKFDFYLRGKEFLLETDHKPLVHLQSSRCSNDRVMRWALQLQNYPYRVVHIAGRDNVGADLLSRCPGK
ncbi:hypothetical protein Pcinc_016976 [Petrolisthes cinctipes]|uniref:Reverse transcriptase RNase H-like domain-containing protein n=1 Tax=Petrolisthes cinctipes TaxID=88211 RepID=A0AAE1KP78_PETCI|nr:hypothetical protein Pcinc_016976 [Petrolisthes cinctipes]